MTNHFHLLLRTGAAPIATVMRRLLTGYAVSFNRRHRRHGHLFQNRYKSILCQEDPYLLELVRSYFQRVIDWRKKTKSGTGSKRAMLLGDTRIGDERGFDIEKTEHRVLDGERIRNERTANRRGARMDAFGR